MTTTLDKFVLPYDPAIDWAETPIAWLKNRDFDALRVKLGQRPVVYHCARLAASQFASVHDVANEVERMYRAFRMSVRKIEWPSRSWEPTGVGSPGFSSMTEAEMVEHTDIPGICEIGGQIIEKVGIPRDCGVGFTLQPSSLRALDVALRLLRSAGQNQKSPPPTASEPAASSEP